MRLDVKARSWTLAARGLAGVGLLCILAGLWSHLSGRPVLENGTRLQGVVVKCDAHDLKFSNAILRIGPIGTIRYESPSGEIRTFRASCMTRDMFDECACLPGAIVDVIYIAPDRARLLKSRYAHGEPLFLVSVGALFILASIRLLESNLPGPSSMFRNLGGIIVSAPERASPGWIAFRTLAWVNLLVASTYCAMIVLAYFNLRLRFWFPIWAVVVGISTLLGAFIVQRIPLSSNGLHYVAFTLASLLGAVAYMHYM